MELERVHSCEESEGKIVNIEVDFEQDKTFCGYCGEEVDYSTYLNEQLSWKTRLKIKFAKLRLRLGL